MNFIRPIAVVGSGPILEIARSLATELLGPDRVIVAEARPERIADVDVRTLIGRVPGELDAFNAVRLHALNHARADLCAKLVDAGYALATLVHPRAFVDGSASLSSDVVVCTGGGIGPGTTGRSACIAGAATDSPGSRRWRTPISSATDAASAPRPTRWSRSDLHPGPSCSSVRTRTLGRSTAR